jgi:hypothetical protein
MISSTRRQAWPKPDNGTRRRCMGVSVIERVKIQAQVLVPLVKALQAELGEERANALVRKTVGNVFRRLGEQCGRF